MGRLFGTDGVRGLANKDITAELALELGAAAARVLGPDAVADSLPLLQPLALDRSTRSTLRQLARERAQRQREAVLEASRAAKEAREARDAKEAEAARGRAEETAARLERELRQLRAQVTKLEEQSGEQRRQTRSERDEVTVRARLLLETINDAAVGLRRELGLPSVSGRPGRPHPGWPRSGARTGRSRWPGLRPALSTPSR